MGFQIGHKLNIGNQYAKGMRHTDEWKQEAKKRLIGNTYGFVKGKPSTRKGKKSLKPVWNKGIKLPQFSGEKHWNWTGGKSRLIHSLYNPEYIEWRQCVFIRDGFKCKLEDDTCSNSLQAHHILRWAEYPELRYDINNGITLCTKHHPRKKSKEIELIPLFRKLII